jgi:Holliday junction resolvase RusA-like endonuclease
VTVLRFTVPGRPVGVNELYDRTPRGLRKSDAARAFEAVIAHHGTRARRAAKLETLTGPVDVLITYFFESERPDGDGPTKLVLDALQPMKAHPHPAHRRIGAGIVLNDRQVRDHHVRRRVDRERPRVELVVGPAGEVFTLSLVLEASSYPQTQLPPAGESVNGWDDAWERKRGPGHGGKDLTKAAP